MIVCDFEWTPRAIDQPGFFHLDLTPSHFAKARQMSNPSVIAGEQAEVAPFTLGDVLYAACRAPVPEKDWARLVESIAGGDQVALHALYDRASRIVFTLALRITANPETAEELTVDVFHDVWRRASSYDPEAGTVIAWIMNQARSRAIDRLRFENRKKRAHVNGGASPPEPQPDPRDVLELRQQGELLRAALVALTADEREAIEATFFAGLTHVEAANRLNQPLGTVKTRIRSGLYKLRSSLSPEAGQL
jgi:RNA polymerase sigma-70 factor (ECF subfamily)